MQRQIAAAIHEEGVRVHHLPSGAGHDGMAIIDIAPIGMLFVRCKGGISHNPAEAVTLADVATGLRVFARFIVAFTPPARRGLHAALSAIFVARIVATSRTRSWRSSCACPRTTRRAIARRTRNARRSSSRRWASRSSAIRVPQDAVRANGMVSCTNLVVRARFGTGRGPVDRAQRARRRRPARARLDRRSLRRGGARRRHVRARRRGVEVGLRDVRVRAARAAWPRPRRARSTARSSCISPTTRKRAARSAPRGCSTQKISRPDYAISAGFAYGITTAHNGCLHLEVEVVGKSGHAAEPEKGIDALEAADGRARRSLCAAQDLRRDRESRDSRHRLADARGRPHQGRHQHQRGSRQCRRSASIGASSRRRIPRKSKRR